jgi:hypothetical protein
MIGSDGQAQLVDVDERDRRLADVAGLALYLADAVTRGEQGWEVALHAIREIAGSDRRLATDAVPLVAGAGDSGALASELLIRSAYAAVA